MENGRFTESSIAWIWAWTSVSSNLPLNSWSVFGIEDIAAVAQTGVDGVEGGEENVSLSSVYTRSGFASGSNIVRDLRKDLSLVRCLTLPKEAALAPRSKVKPGKDSIMDRGSNSSEGTSGRLEPRICWSKSDSPCEVTAPGFPLRIPGAIVSDQRDPRLVLAEGWGALRDIPGVEEK